MASFFYPAADEGGNPARLVDILEPRVDDALQIVVADDAETKRGGTRAQLKSLTLRARRDVPIRSSSNGLPLLIYYPAGESTRFASAAVCEQLAAAGYIVAAIDAPRDAPAVVYPDGKIALPPMRKRESYITPRVADVRCLLDSLLDPSFERLDGCAIDSGRIGMFGHSRGGYLSNICAVEDPRIRAAVNMDGFLWGLWTEGTGLNRFPLDFQERARALQTPILRLRSARPNREAVEEAFLLESADFGGPFTFVALNGYSHGAFATTPYLGNHPEAALASLDAGNPPTFSVAGTCLGLLLPFFSAALNRAPGELNVGWPEVDGYLFERRSESMPARVAPISARML